MCDVMLKKLTFKEVDRAIYTLVQECNIKGISIDSVLAANAEALILARAGWSAQEYVERSNEIFADVVRQRAIETTKGLSV